jgi:hypothetical protein
MFNRFILFVRLHFNVAWTYFFKGYIASERPPANCCWQIKGCLPLQEPLYIHFYFLPLSFVSMGHIACHLTIHIPSEQWTFPSSLSPSSFLLC